jgi:hypothetical protein
MRALPRHARPAAAAVAVGLVAFVSGAGDQVAASVPAPPPDSSDSVPDAGAGLRQFFAGLGEVVYQGDDIEVGDCPLVTPGDVTGAFAGTGGAVSFVAESEAEVGWLGEDPAAGDVVKPVLLTCTFEVPDDDSSPEVGVGAIDLTDPSADEWRTQFATLPVAPAQLAVGGSLRGACEEGECAVVWTGSEVAVLVYADYEEDGIADLASVLAAADPLITTSLEQLVALA